MSTSCPGSVPRASALAVEVSRFALTFVLGRCGSVSRNCRSTSSSRCFFHCVVSNGKNSRQQFVENDAQRVHVRARVDIVQFGICLLRAHVSRRTQKCAHLREQGFVPAMRVRLPSPGRSR